MDPWTWFIISVVLLHAYMRAQLGRYAAMQRHPSARRKN